MADVFEQFSALPTQSLKISGIGFEGGGKWSRLLNDLQDPVSSGSASVVSTDIESDAEVRTGGGNAGSEFLAIGHEGGR